MNFVEIEKAVYKWAKDRSIFEQSDSIKQMQKLGEEFSELDEAVSKIVPNRFEVIDAIGDMMVVLTIIAFMNHTNLLNCYETAWDQIKDRKGKIVNGIFVKEKE